MNRIETVRRYPIRIATVIQAGAIAHGHAIGASGAVPATRLMHSMKRGIVTLCIGGGRGIALALKTV